MAFALFEPLGEGLHLEEVDVHPDHGRQGLGARLIDAGAARARELGLREITLTTFREIPWNAPYYERIGFRVLARTDWSGALVAQVAEEARGGLDPEKRVVMRRPVDDVSEGGDS